MIPLNPPSPPTFLSRYLHLSPLHPLLSYYSISLLSLFLLISILFRLHPFLLSHPLILIMLFLLHSLSSFHSIHLFLLSLVHYSSSHPLILTSSSLPFHPLIFILFHLAAPISPARYHYHLFHLSALVILLHLLILIMLSLLHSLSSSYFVHLFLISLIYYLSSFHSIRLLSRYPLASFCAIYSFPHSFSLSLSSHYLSPTPLIFCCRLPNIADTRSVLFTFARCYYLGTPSSILNSFHSLYPHILTHQTHNLTSRNSLRMCDSFPRCLAN